MGSRVKQREGLRFIGNHVSFRSPVLCVVRFLLAASIYVAYHPEHAAELEDGAATGEMQ